MMNAAKELLTFIENSPSMFHSIETIKGMLDEQVLPICRRELLGREAGWNVLHDPQPFQYHCVPRRKGTGRLPFPDVRLPQ